MIEAGWKGQEESEKNVNKWQEGQKIQPDFSIKKRIDQTAKSFE